MRPTLRALLLATVLLPGVAGLSLAAQGAKEKEGKPDLLVEAPPGEPPTGPAPAPNPKSKRSAITLQKRNAVNAEVKAFSFNHRGFARDRASRPVVVRGGEAKIREQLQEDLAVMGRILEKNLTEYREDHEEVAGIHIPAAGGGIRALYLEDYGVLFTINVNIPLKPEPKSDDAEERRQHTVNEEWHEARIEVLGERSVRIAKFPRREFDPQQVAELRDAVTDSLRHASNIRHLRETDSVTVVLRGRNTEALEGQFDVFIPGEGRAAITNADERGAESIIVARVRKRDLDEFGRRKGTADEFKRKISITTY